MDLSRAPREAIGIFDGTEVQTKGDDEELRSGGMKALREERAKRKELEIRLAKVHSLLEDYEPEMPDAPLLKELRAILSE